MPKKRPVISTLKYKDLPDYAKGAIQRHSFAVTPAPRDLEIEVKRGATHKTFLLIYTIPGVKTSTTIEVNGFPLEKTNEMIDRVVEGDTPSDVISDLIE